jgi:hypothetical protein
MSGHTGAHIYSDQYLVIADLRAQISNVKKVNCIRTSIQNVFKLTPSEVAEKYRQQIKEKLNHITLTGQNN